MNTIDTNVLPSINPDKACEIMRATDEFLAMIRTTFPDCTRIAIEVDTVNGKISKTDLFSSQNSSIKFPDIRLVTNPKGQYIARINGHRENAPTIPTYDIKKIVRDE